MKSKKYKDISLELKSLNEPEVVYGVTKQLKINNDLNFNDFQKVASKVDFTQKEWADILHLSERTLQRYAHDNGSFNSNVVDRLIQIKKVVQRGQEVFGSYERFNLWLRGNPYMLESQLSIHSLASIEGINNVLTQLGRIEHGILA
ncbi:MAG: antitoxin Xre-like helix-turn-helix domain-containing protein [Ginsengibacter sp.]